MFITIVNYRINETVFLFSFLQFVALYDYDPFKSSPNPNPASELSFKEGDILRVIDTSRQDGFYVGKVLLTCSVMRW